MKASVSAKRCPQCGKVTGLYAEECGACGHRFRTRFVEPADRAEAFDAVMLPRLSAARPFLPRRRGPSPFVLAFLGSFCLVVTAGLAAWLAWNLSRGPAANTAHTSAGLSASASLPAAYEGARRSGRAEDLYEKIEMAMSLYDVDQAAGGMGRLIHSSSPHVLLLSYDYPDQSVRVSLYRGDLTGDDYRVQAVAIYRGKILLRRHADDN